MELESRSHDPLTNELNTYLDKYLICVQVLCQELEIQKEARSLSSWSLHPNEKMKTQNERKEI